ncbi:MULTISPECIES: MarR family winged helix-turn-helix transcriptional regulator [unclassified Sporosarcina]|uniref:MarR family winged helix-turn-helix transcriptional regulator n=1 Tax=unclassified Sporosarcina TaxID=2647733 RepID=UPI001E3F82C1|nr:MULTISPECIES: MarR family transcriptional regulator [unclassified Sporosarcina]
MTPHQLFFHQYRSMYRPYINAANDCLGRHQLFTAQWAVMKYIISTGPRTLVDIAAYQHVEKPTITRTVQKLIELHYVEVIPGKDKREKKIQLTELGRQVSADVEITIEQFQLNALEGISIKEQMEVSRILEKVKNNLVK